MTQVSEWGPPLWKVLHGYAEHAGTSILPVDELRAWVTVLRLTEGVLPCPACRAHYREWRHTHPIEDLLQQRGEGAKEWIRRWLWGIHDAVNERKGYTHFPYEELSIYASYTAQELQQSFTTLLQILDKAVLYRQVNSSHVVSWKKAMLLLRKLNS